MNMNLEKCITKSVVLGVGKMLRHEIIRKQFLWGISVLSAYMKYNKTKHYKDINIFSEGFAKELLNILYEYDLSVTENEDCFCYDLISESKQIVIKILIEATDEAIRQVIEALSNQIKLTLNRKLLLQNKIEDTNKIIEDLNSTISYLKNQLNLITNTQKHNKRREINEEIERLESTRAENKQKVEYLDKLLNDIEDIRGYNFIFFSFISNEYIDSDIGNSFDELIYKLPIILDKSILSINKIEKDVNNMLLENASFASRLSELMKSNPKIFFERECEILENSKITEIIKEYSKNFCSTLFLHKYNDEHKVTLENLFVEPTLSHITNDEVESNSKNNNGIVTLLDEFLWDSKRDRILFLDGDAAIGKTSMISWLCYHYLKMDDIGKAIFLNEELICVRLRELSITNDFNEQSVLSYLGFDDKETFNSNHETALIVLEGADELGIINNFSVEQFILKIRHTFNTQKIIVTSRPKYINMHEISTGMQPFSYQHFSIDHFSAEKRTEWMRNYESKDKCNQSIAPNTKKYINELTETEAAGVADTPLALYLLVSCNMTNELRNNKWSLYYGIFHNAIRNVPYNEVFSSNVPTTFHKAFKETTFADDVYMTVEEIAYCMFSNIDTERFYITWKELDKITSKMSNSSMHSSAIRKCCVLSAYWKENTGNGALEFYHNNIRDFFMCEYIYRKFSQIDLFDDTENSIHKFILLACEIFQYGKIAKSTWEQTFTFLYYKLHSRSCDIYARDIIDNKRKGTELYEKILKTSLYGNDIWKYNFQRSYYHSVKTTFHNYLIFLRIWLSPITPVPLELNSRSFEEGFWSYNEVLNDWKTVYSDCIEVSKREHISFASYTRYKDVNFAGKYLSNSCFEGSEFVGVTFQSSNLSKSNFSNSRLTEVDFSYSDLSDASFKGATITNTDFSDSLIAKADFTQSNIKDSKLPKNTTALYELNFEDATVSNCTLKSMDLKNVCLSGVSFFLCKFNRVKFPKSLRNVKFIDCVIENCSLYDCDRLVFEGEKSVINETRFYGEYSSILFKNVILCSSDWTNSTLNGVIFENSKIKDLSLRGSKVLNAKYDGCTVNGTVDAYKAVISADILKEIECLNNNIIM